PRGGGKGLAAAEIRTPLALTLDGTKGVFSLFFTTGRIEAAHLHGVVAKDRPKESSAKKDKTVNLRDPLRAINLSFVAVSDALLERLGKHGEVRCYPASPRVHIAGLSGRARRFSLDLRHDLVRA